MIVKCLSDSMDPAGRSLVVAKAVLSDLIGAGAVARLCRLLRLPCTDECSVALVNVVSCTLATLNMAADGPAAIVKCGGVAAVLDALRLLRKTTAATATFSAWNVHSLAAILHRIIHVAVESSPIQSRWIQAVDGRSAQGPPVRPGTTADLVSELMAVYGTGGRFPD